VKIGSHRATNAFLSHQGTQQTKLSQVTIPLSSQREREREREREDTHMKRRPASFLQSDHTAFSAKSERERESPMPLAAPPDEDLYQASLQMQPWKPARLTHMSNLPIHVSTYGLDCTPDPKERDVAACKKTPRAPRGSLLVAADLPWLRPKSGRLACA